MRTTPFFGSASLSALEWELATLVNAPQFCADLRGQIEEVKRQKRPFRNSSVKLASTALSPGALLKSARAIMRKYKGLIFILSDEFLAGSDWAFFQPGCH